MKILVLSLLRLGDILMMTPVFRDIKKLYPNCQIDVLINSQFNTVNDLNLSVDNFLHFERSILQNILCDEKKHILTPFYKIKEQIKILNQNKYNILINLTNNQLSSYLATLINAESKIGLHYNDLHKIKYNSPWFYFLNNQSHFFYPSLFHFVDLYYYGSGLNNKYHPLSFLEQDKVNNKEKEKYQNKKIIEKFITNEKINIIKFNQNSNNNNYRNKSVSKIMWQIFSNSESKNWPFEHLIKTLKNLNSFSNRNYQHNLLLAPFEVNKAQPLINDLKKLSIPFNVIIADLPGVLAVLKEGDILISPDTGIKHLASGTKIKIIELAIGESNIYETGTYGDNHIIVQSKTYYSSNTTKNKKLYSNNISSISIAQLIKLLTSKKQDYKIFSEITQNNHKYKSENIFCSKINSQGFLQIIPLYSNIAPGIIPNINSINISANNNIDINKISENKKKFQSL